ncbi:MAG TPA: META domain-containing protein [Xanthobacteraceae bacterium]|nr:META domain-containing protein [Xanthobacteraceae bacterium]
MIRMMFACLLVCAAVPFAPRASASDESFPFGSDLMLDAEPMRGSKRVPIIEIEENGSATIDLWCSSAHADATVGDDSITIVPGPPQESAACTSERADSDQSLLAALALVTKWRRQGEVIELTGPTTLRFRLMTN